MFLVNRNMEVGCSSNSSQVVYNNPDIFYDFFSNSSENLNNSRGSVNAHQNPNLDFTVEFKLFNTVIKATPSVGFTKVENNSSNDEVKSEETSDVSVNADMNINLSLSLSPPNDAEVNRDGDLGVPGEEDVVVDAVPLNMYNPLNNNIEWTITKRLTKSDCDAQSRLLIPKRKAEVHILPLLSESNRLKIKSPKGLRIDVLDCDIRYELKLTLKKWGSTEYYGLMKHWKRDFVNTRGLIPGDVVGLCWDVDSNRLFFSVLWRNRNRIPQDLIRKEKTSRL